MDKKMDTQNFTADFGTAIKWLKEGKKVARKGWNGKNMWLVLCHLSESKNQTNAHKPTGSKRRLNAVDTL